MPDKDILHIRISKDMADKVNYLIDKGLFSNKNEVIREAIRSIILKYKDEVKIKK
jgi:Arc/MetJ-type ribon-helix-helix transcriptional regulator